MHRLSSQQELLFCKEWLLFLPDKRITKENSTSSEVEFLLLFKFGEWGEFLLNSLYDPAGIDSIGVRTGGQGQNILSQNIGN